MMQRRCVHEDDPNDAKETKDAKLLLGSSANIVEHFGDFTLLVHEKGAFGPWVSLETRKSKL
jgi:hypothetical protein